MKDLWKRIQHPACALELSAREDTALQNSAGPRHRGDGVIPGS